MIKKMLLVDVPTTSARHKTLFFIFSYIIIIAVAAGHAASAPQHVTYSFTLTNLTARVADEVHFWTYAPIGQINLQTSVPYRLIQDDLGNQVLHFTFNNIPPYGAQIIQIEAGITPAVQATPDIRPYLKAEPFCEADAPAIRTLAKQLQGQTAKETVENIYRWVADNVRFVGYLKEPRGALSALQYKEGDCTEYMYLFVALCRANKISARGIGGYLAGNSPVLKANNYHNWAECYLDGAWQLVDPQRKVFMKDQNRYIPLHVIGEAPENPITGPNKFAYKGEGIEIRMNQ
jgi:hypothetical protein